MHKGMDLFWCRTPTWVVMWENFRGRGLIFTRQPLGTLSEWVEGDYERVKGVKAGEVGWSQHMESLKCQDTWQK